MRAASALIAGLTLSLTLSLPASALAQEPSEAQRNYPEATFPGAAELGQAMAQMGSRTWIGPRVELPEEAERPVLPGVELGAVELGAVELGAVELGAVELGAVELGAVEVGGVRVHGPSDDARALGVAEAVDEFARYLDAAGFERPINDGGLGGSDGFDIYLVPTEDLRAVHSDGRVRWSYHDRVSAFAIVDPLTTGADLELCAIEAYARGALLSLLPDEAETWHNAYASWLTWRWTGRFGCADALERQQSEPERSWVMGAADEGAGGGLLLAMVSERHSAGTGVFLREMLQTARQRTWEGEGLRGSPDLWQVLLVSLDAAGSRLNDLVGDFGVDRYFIARPHAVFAALADQSARVPVGMHTELSMLPYHSAEGPTLEPHGSAYLLVDVRGAPEQSRLRVWLRGEYGVEWSLSAVQLSADGRNLGLLSAPPRRGDPRVYLPVELAEETTHVLAVATNLSHRLPDADDKEDPNGRAFRFIVDIAQDD